MTFVKVEQNFLGNVYDIYDISLLRETKSLEAIGLKLTEEVGEVAEQINVICGNINKDLKEPIEGEIADLLNCALCILFKAYPEHNVYEILAKLNMSMEAKNKKWVSNLTSTKITSL
jgi:NTP pyrophosphatase (non-canonical NTP hydrolase)